MDTTVTVLLFTDTEYSLDELLEKLKNLKDFGSTHVMLEAEDGDNRKGLIIKSY